MIPTHERARGAPFAHTPGVRALARMEKPRSINPKGVKECSHEWSDPAPGGEAQPVARNPGNKNRPGRGRRRPMTRLGVSFAPSGRESKLSDSIHGLRFPFRGRFTRGYNPAPRRGEEDRRHLTPLRCAPGPGRASPRRRASASPATRVRGWWPVLRLRYRTRRDCRVPRRRSGRCIRCFPPPIRG